jgi:ATP-dependent Clp protease ATP-binding subunit ClpB
MTSNLGSGHIVKGCSSEDVLPPSIRGLITSSIQCHFPPEFINRIDEIIFYVRRLLETLTFDTAQV